MWVVLRSLLPRIRVAIELVLKFEVYTWNVFLLACTQISHLLVFLFCFSLCLATLCSLFSFFLVFFQLFPFFSLLILGEVTKEFLYNYDKISWITRSNYWDYHHLLLLAMQPVNWSHSHGGTSLRVIILNMTNQPDMYTIQS